MAVPDSCQHQAVPHIQEDHPGAHGYINHQEEAERWNVSLNLIRFLFNTYVLCTLIILFSYKGKDEFKDDVGLIFQNCQIFNEDDSPVGKCGRNMKTFFHKRWTDLTSN